MTPPDPSSAHTHKHSRSRHWRARIRHAAFTATPLWLSGGKLAQVRDDQPIGITRRDVRLPDLPLALDGLTITHLTDLHIGKLTTPDHLAGIMQTANGLHSDLIAVTGDFLDLSTNVLEQVIDALHLLKAPLGVHMVPGNHDYLHNAREFLRRFHAANLGLLVNQSVSVMHKEARINIAGVDFTHSASSMARMVHRTLLTSGKIKADFTLLLAHHPNAFDAAQRHGVDLTLAGHTHGGQLALTSTRGKKGSIGLGSMAFKYPRGLYRRGLSYLFVSTGVGSWFPFRVNCPAEIAQLTLRRGAPVLQECK